MHSCGVNKLQAQVKGILSHPTTTLHYYGFKVDVKIRDVMIYWYQIFNLQPFGRAGIINIHAQYAL